jgi:4-hydroxy-tetrahydrodipicolinate synthase
MAKPIVGNIPAIVTPFSDKGELMLDAFGALIDWHPECAVDGLCIAGDNGEPWALTKDERKALFETGVKRVRGRVPVICGASATTARDSIAYAELAASAGADAILLQPQAYVLKATRSEMVARYAAVAKAVPIPVVAYNSPRRTGLNMDPDTFAAVCDAGSLSAIASALADKPRASSSSLSSSPGCGTGPANGRVRAIAIVRFLVSDNPRSLHSKRGRYAIRNRSAIGR